MSGEASEETGVALSPFDEKELDKLLRQMVDRERGNYFEHGTTGRGIPSKLKQIINDNIERLTR